MTSKDDISHQASELRQQAEEIALEKSALSLEDFHAMSAEERLRVAFQQHGHGLVQSGHGPAYTVIHNSLLTCLERADNRSASLQRNSP